MLYQSLLVVNISNHQICYRATVFTVNKTLIVIVIATRSIEHKQNMNNITGVR